MTSENKPVHLPADIAEAITLILTDPDSSLSDGAVRALRWMQTWVSEPLYPSPPKDTIQKAARYDWLRDNCVREWVSRLESTKGKKTLDIEFEADGHDLDAALDAALAKHKEV